MLWKVETKTLWSSVWYGPGPGLGCRGEGVACFMVWRWVREGGGLYIPDFLLLILAWWRHSLSLAWPGTQFVIYPIQSLIYRPDIYTTDDMDDYFQRLGMDIVSYGTSIQEHSGNNIFWRMDVIHEVFVDIIFIQLHAFILGWIRGMTLGWINFTIQTVISHLTLKKSRLTISRRWG